MSARLCSFHVYDKDLEQMASVGWNNEDKSSQFTGKKGSTARQKECHLIADKRSACIIQLIPERVHFMQRLPKHPPVNIRRAHPNTRILPHKHKDLCLHPGKRLDSPSILPNQIYSESKLKGTFNQPLWVCLSIWEQQQSSLLGAV